MEENKMSDNQQDSKNVDIDYSKLKYCKNLFSEEEVKSMKEAIKAIQEAQDKIQKMKPLKYE